MTNKFTHPDNAKEDHKWITRGGRKVTQVIALDVPNNRHPIVAVIGDEVYSFTSKGTLWGDMEGPLDLFDAPKGPREWWDILKEDGTLLLRTNSENEANVEFNHLVYAYEIVHVQEVIKDG